MTPSLTASEVLPATGDDPVRTPEVETAKRTPARRPRLYILDGLRILAAVAAMTWHYAGFQRLPHIWAGKAGDSVPALHHFAIYGWVGVELFFIISGFVICMSCWGRSVGQFVTSRVTRLFPAYWVGVLLTSTMVFLTRPAWIGDIKGWKFSDILTDLTMVQEGIGGRDIDGVYWTLWVELRFYVLFGLLAIGGLTYRKVVAFCGAWTILSVYATNTNVPWLDLATLPNYSPYFIAGIAMYLMHRFGPNLVLWGLIGSSWLLAQNQLHVVVGLYSWDAQGHVSYTVALALITLAFVVMTGVALGWFDRLQWKWLAVAGSLTYPVYLIHQQLGWWVIHELHGKLNPYLLLALLITGMLFVAWLIHRLVERPLSDIIKRGMERALRDIRVGTVVGGGRS